MMCHILWLCSLTTSMSTLALEKTSMLLVLVLPAILWPMS